jgi:hypothetical protein
MRLDITSSIASQAGAIALMGHARFRSEIVDFQTFFFQNGRPLPLKPYKSSYTRPTIHKNGRQTWYQRQQCESQRRKNPREDSQ